MVVGRYRQADSGDVDRAVGCAVADPDGWRALAAAEARFARLGRVADELRRSRGDLIGAAMADGGKTISESDPEVSEAIDFVEFYRANARWWQEYPGAIRPAKGRGRRGLALEFPHRHSLRGRGRRAGRGQYRDPQAGLRRGAGRLGAVPLFLARAASRRRPCNSSLAPAARKAGNWSTMPASMPSSSPAAPRPPCRCWRDKPSLNLTAETGGKNATIVTAMADRDQAIKHVIHSAFSHAGQKCSATSLLLLEAEVYDDAKFNTRCATRSRA